AGISRSTLYHLEKGDANTSFGSLLQVMVALRLENDLGQVGADDLLGRKLMDAGLEKLRVSGKQPHRRAEP
ncbi:MAG TPA: transcriptional regulator, partial [Planctomycetaceae bacterium]|nr:transcriptional regulator [Planctomycetaceae bacterium]